MFSFFLLGLNLPYTDFCQSGLILCRRLKLCLRKLRLLWREKYVIKDAEKSVYSTGIFPVINMSPRDMSVITGTSGKKASCQCYRQKFHFIFHKLLLAGFSETLSVTNRQQRSHPAAGLLYPLLRFLAVDEADQCAETRHQIRQIPHSAKN